jgi:hypothetical protein
MNSDGKKSGFALLAIVGCLTLTMGILATSFALSSNSRALTARRNLFMEQAQFVAEAGAEMAVGYLASSNNPAVPVLLSNSVGNGSCVARVWLVTNFFAATRSYAIASTGTVNGVTRGVLIDGARQRSWATHAFRANDNRNIYFKSGETFNGLVHVNTALYFVGNPEFFGDLESASTTVVGSTNACIFHRGLQLGVPADTLVNVNFDAMKNVATLVTTGQTTLVFQGTNMLVTNTARGWTNRSLATPTNGVIYAVTAGSTNGDVSVWGQVDGRVTIVSDRDISVVSNLTYASDPATNSACNDATGLIARRDVIVPLSFPNNGMIYAHILATGALTPTVDTDGSFGVQNYTTRPPSGFLTVYGGIAQEYRGAVGTFSGATLISGFNKNYTFDQRFAMDPPPEYPPVSDRYAWSAWRAGR